MAEVIGTGAGTLTSGQRTQAAVAAARRVTQYLGKHIDISGDVAPFYLLTQKVGMKKTVRQPSYIHLEDDQMPISVTTSGTHNDSTTSIALASGHGKRVVAGQILKCLRTEEVFRVASVSTDTLTVATRPFGGSAASLNSAETLAIIGHADTDGNTAQGGRSNEPTIKTNYCQIFRDVFELSGRDIESENYGEDELERVRTKTANAHVIRKEMTFLFSNMVNTSDPYVTGGVDYWITTNLTNVGGAFTESGFNTFIRDWMRRNQGAKNCVIFAGENFCTAVDGFGRDNIRYSPDDEIMGIKCGGYRTSFSNEPVKIIRHGLLSPLGSDETAANKGFVGMAYGLSLGNCGIATYKNRGMKQRDNIQTPGTDGMKWELMSDEGFVMMNEKAHAKLYGITG